MRKQGMLLSLSAALFFCSCAFGPQMRMSEPEDSTDFNGMKVFMHDVGDGDLGQGIVQATNSQDSSLYGDIKELLVDSLPNLEYRIGPLDMVQIVVWEHPELTSPMGQYQTTGQKVTTDGKLFYPYAGEIEAAGLTAQELRAEITKRLSNKILNDPQVDVRVTGYNSLKAFASGEVKNPGSIRFDEKPVTLPEAIAEVGGFTENADLSMIQIRRDGKIYNLDYSSVFASNLPVDKILLKPNDQIYVASLEETQKNDRVYVMGEVQRAGVVGMRDGELTLMDALASSGGLESSSASARLVYVIRSTGSDRLDVFHLDTKNALALAMANKFELNAHDIVYVDASDLATWNRLLNLIMPSVNVLDRTIGVTEKGTSIVENVYSTKRTRQLIKMGK